MDKLQRKLRPFGTVRSIKKGGGILFQGETPQNVMFVREGLIRAYTISSTGDEHIVALYGKGNIFPLAWALDQAPDAMFYYDALADARLLAIPKQVFLEKVMNDKEIMASMLKFTANEYTSLLLRITGLEQSKAIEKIAFTLYYLLLRHGTEKRPGIFTINLKLSQLVIANLVGLTRESTTKNLHILKKKGVITYRYSTYVVNKEKLEAFLDEDGFQDVTITA